MENSIEISHAWAWGFSKHMFEGLLTHDFHCPIRVFLLSVALSWVSPRLNFYLSSYFISVLQKVERVPVQFCSSILSFLLKFYQYLLVKFWMGIQNFVRFYAQKFCHPRQNLFTFCCKNFGEPSPNFVHLYYLNTSTRASILLSFN